MMAEVAEPQIAPPVIETTPGTTELHEPTHGDGKRKWHIVTRTNSRHAVCGCTVGGKPKPGEEPLNCRRCEEIMELWLDHGIWEGFGPSPGRDRTDGYREWRAEGWE
jgi:hypothetical protein